MVSIKQDFIDRNNRYEYDSRDIWEVKEVYKIGGGYHVAVINNLTGYGNAHLCTYNMDLRTIDDLKARLLQDDNIAKVKNNNINTCKIMEKRMITKPFDLELAKKISNGEREGEIVTIGHNHKVELVYYNKDRGMFNTLGVIYSDGDIISDWFSDNGMGARGCRLCINIPEYTAFKDGDVLSNEEGDYLFILNTNGEYLTSYYASWQEGGYLYFDNGAANQNNIERYRFATKDERQEFIDTIFGRKIDLDEDNQMIDIDISTMKVGDTYSFMNNQKEMVEIKAVKRSMLGCNGCYLSNSEILCKGCNKSERETNDNIMVVRIDKMDDVYRNDRPLDSGIGVVHSFRINNKIIKAVACQTVIRNDICSKCCFVDTNICSNMRCFSSVREDDKSVIFKKIEL